MGFIFLPIILICSYSYLDYKKYQKSNYKITTANIRLRTLKLVRRKDSII